MIFITFHKGRNKHPKKKNETLKLVVLTFESHQHKPLCRLSTSVDAEVLFSSSRPFMTKPSRACFKEGNFLN